MRADVIRTLRAAGCVFAEDEAALLLAAAAAPAELDELVARAGRRAPLEHVSAGPSSAGCGSPSTPGVFVPRRRTELLVEEAARLLRAGGRGAGPVLRLGRARGRAAAGSRRLEVHAADIDPAAVRLCPAQPAAAARSTRATLRRRCRTALRGRVDVLVVNVPYVPTERSR